MKLSILATGSSGNCYILSSDTGKLILDCGLPWPQIQRGLNFNLSDVLGCLVTHFHSDHQRSVRDVLRNGIDVWTSAETLDHMPPMKSNDYRLPYICDPGVQFHIGNFKVLPFQTEHDAEGSIGFLIQYSPTKEKLLYLTDSYYCRYRFNAMNYIMIECNYIKETLDANIEAGLIDPAMKPRLLQSHFSLENVKGFLKANDLSQCRKIILIHLSAANSHAGMMVREIRELTGIETVVADPGLEVELEQYPY
jgi:phosphoribosyl 1,2-cyclic phosphodiesterase